MNFFTIRGKGKTKLSYHSGTSAIYLQPAWLKNDTQSRCIFLNLCPNYKSHSFNVEPNKNPCSPATYGNGSHPYIFVFSTRYHILVVAANVPFCHKAYRERKKKSTDSYATMWRNCMSRSCSTGRSSLQACCGHEAASGSMVRSQCPPPSRLLCRDLRSRDTRSLVVYSKRYLRPFGCFQKYGLPPNHPFVHRVFHYKL